MGVAWFLALLRISLCLGLGGEIVLFLSILELILYLHFFNESVIVRKEVGVEMIQQQIIISLWN